MPTAFNATVVMHLSDAPEAKVGANEKNYWKVRGWTSDRVKGKDGEYAKVFTSIDAIVSGKEGEWLARDCKKGSMVYISGKARVTAYIAKDGTAKGSLNFVHVCEVRSLDAKEDGEQAAAPQKPSKPAPATESPDEPPF